MSDMFLGIYLCTSLPILSASLRHPLQYYPPNINYSRCCDQAICTECFVQIKRNEPTTTHLVSEPAACPYCVQENFGIVYRPPSWRAGHGSDASVSMFLPILQFLLTRLSPFPPWPLIWHSILLGQNHPKNRQHCQHIGDDKRALVLTIQKWS